MDNVLTKNASVGSFHVYIRVHSAPYLIGLCKMSQKLKWKLSDSAPEPFVWLPQLEFRIRWRAGRYSLSYIRSDRSCTVYTPWWKGGGLKVLHTPVGGGEALGPVQPYK